MIVLTGVNFADKENIYKDTKRSLIKFMRDLTEGKAKAGLASLKKVTFTCPALSISTFVSFTKHFLW